MYNAGAGHRREEVEMGAGRRISSGVERGAEFQMVVDGRTVVAYEGETIAAALVASGVTTLRHGPDGSPRGLFCGMGICFECLMTVDGVPNVRVCVTAAAPGMRVETQHEELWRGGER
jgi:D-hydroxyproline dehydrogenase subunit gamma